MVSVVQDDKLIPSTGLYLLTCLHKRALLKNPMQTQEILPRMIYIYPRNRYEPL